MELYEQRVLAAAEIAMILPYQIALVPACTHNRAHDVFALTQHVGHVVCLYLEMLVVR